jgi:Arc/MetJ family transcription regulator
MRNQKRKPVSVTVSEDLIAEVQRTKGPHSVSERFNQLLRRAVVVERYALLEQEAQNFYGSLPAADRDDRPAFQRATLRSLARD